MPSPLFRSRPRVGVSRRRVAFVLACAWAATDVGAQTSPQGGPGGRPYFTCYMGSRVVKSDQEFLECAGVQTRTYGGIEVRLLTPAQVTRQEKCERDKALELEEWRRKDRENKNLVVKYPDATALRKQRDSDLASARESVARSRAKLEGLDKERKRLALEREFYPQANTVPERLQRQIDENGALIAAQEQASKRAEDDISRIGANFDLLEKKMKGLWAGKAEPQPIVDCSVEKLFGPIPRR